MAKTRTPDPEIHALTIAEVTRQYREYSTQRHKVTTELGEIFSGYKAGTPVPQPLTDHAKNVRERAKAMLNGFAPPSLTLPPAVTRETELTIERDALDIVLAALSRSEVVARAADAAQWMIDHEDEWRAMCRDRVLTEIRLEALKDRALEMREQAGGMYAGHLPMARYIISRDVTVMDMQIAALDEGIITQADIKRATDVE